MAEPYMATPCSTPVGVRDSTYERTDVRTDERFQDSTENTQVSYAAEAVETVYVDHVPFTGSDWWKFSAVAEKHGTTAARLLAELAHRMVNPPVVSAEESFGPRRTPIERRKMTQRREAKLRELHALGFGDDEIGRVIGLSDSSVQRYRSRMGLPAVGVRGRRATERKEVA